MLFCTGIAQYSICTSDPYTCPQNFTYNSNSTSDQFTLNATIIFTGSGMSCCHEGVSNPVWTVITNPGASGQRVENCEVFDPPGINICTETSPDLLTNIARLSISDANTSFQIIHSIYTDVDGGNHLQRSVIFNFYYLESEEYVPCTKLATLAMYS